MGPEFIEYLTTSPPSVSAIENVTQTASLHCPLLQSDPDLTPLPSTPYLTQQSSSATRHFVTTVALQHLQQSVPPSARRISQAVSPPSSSPALQVLKKFSRFHRVVNRYCYYSDTILNFEDLKSALI
nr:hypothetical protein Iba_chr06aCG4240 [Ipomoea batatas]GMD10203.1 hypothetical protein Iba_chr06eCG4020 [Ipomoea batatas]